jgi:predicted aldo/keto reductase-like oxidoreductase
MEAVVIYGVNHIDVAPSYGAAELRMGNWLERDRERFFLGCKTMEREKGGAATELHQSLERLRVDQFDLYQIHAITSMEELDSVTQPGGALEALIEARDQGLTKFIGITGHGVDSPSIFIEALRRFDFDTVLFPLNAIQCASPAFRSASEELLSICKSKDVGTMVIKSITRGPWGEKVQTFDTWYEPFTEMDDIQAHVNFVLSHEITGICTAGDVRLLPLVLRACENYTPISSGDREKIIESSKAYEPLFT